LVFVMLIPRTRQTETERVVQLAPPERIEDIPEEEEPQEVPEPEATEPVLQDPEITDPVTDEVTESFGDFSETAMTESAFNSDAWNAAVGLGGGAGGPKYSGRGSGRGRLGRTGTVVTLERALQWLKDHQDEDGKWDADDFMKHDVEGEPCDGPGNAVHDVGLTGLALLAFLGDGSTLRSGPYRDVVRKGVKWLREQQDEDTGLFGTANSNEFVYDHAIATLAMVEAYGLSDYKLLRKNAQMGINYLEAHRNPYSVWRYQPRDNANDTSVTGWCVMAYKAAQDFDLDVNT